MAGVPLGVQNNNPLNMRPDGRSNWQGLAEPPTMNVPGQGGYLVFADAPFGWRAPALNLIAYQDRFGLRTIRQIVNRWAPAEDNNHPASYANAVAQRTGFSADQALDLHSYEHLKPLMLAMASVELGADPYRFYSDAQIDKGLLMAGVQPPQKSLAKSRTVIGGVTSSAGTAGTALPAPDPTPVSTATPDPSMIDPVKETVQEAAWSFQSIMHYVDEFRWVFIVLTITGIALTIWARLDDRKRGLR